MGIKKKTLGNWFGDHRIIFQLKFFQLFSLTTLKFISLGHNTDICLLGGMKLKLNVAHSTAEAAKNLSKSIFLPTFLFLFGFTESSSRTFAWLFQLFISLVVQPIVLEDKISFSFCQLQREQQRDFFTFSQYLTPVVVLLSSPLAGREMTIKIRRRRKKNPERMTELNTTGWENGVSKKQMKIRVKFIAF